MSVAMYRTFSTIVLMANFLTSTANSQVPGYTITSVSGPIEVGGLVTDTSGNLFFILGSVMKLSTGGVISIVAGGGTCGVGLVGDGGPATSGCLLGPSALAMDASGNLFIADTFNRRIRKVSTAGIITTVAGPGSTNGALGDGGPATSATLNLPEGIAVDSSGNLYIADTGNARIRKVSIDGTISTVAGVGSTSSSQALGDGGPATNAQLSLPTSVAVDMTGNLFIVDSGHYRIRKVTPAGTITTVAGTGTPGYIGDGGPAVVASIGSTLASISSSSGALPPGLAVDATGNLYYADGTNFRLRTITTNGNINTIAGNGTYSGVFSSGDGGPATSTGVSALGVAVGTGGKIYVSSFPSGIRVLTPSGGFVSPIPSIATDGVSSASGWGQFSQLAPGSWAAIYGNYLAQSSRSWGNADFSGINAPTSLDGTSVSIGGLPAFVSYISPGQINVQVPSNVGTGGQSLVVTTSAGKSSSYVVTVNGTQPGVLAPPSFQINSIQYAVALFPDGAYVLPSGAIPGLLSRPAKTGDTITFYGIGFGPVTPSVPAGQIVSSSNALSLPFHVYIGVSQTEAVVSYAGLAPGAVGLYQFNVVVPALSITGTNPVQFTLDGVAVSQSLAIATQ